MSLQKSFHLMNLSLPVDGSEQRKVSFQGLSIDFPKEGLIDWRDGAEILRSWQTRIGRGR